jgi:hypothetical protein
VQHIEITPNRREVIEGIAALTAPYLLVGTVDEIREQLATARDRWDFTYFVTRSPDQTAPIIEALHQLG